MNTCKCCGSDLYVFTQPALVPGGAATTLAHCIVMGCRLYAVTLELNTLASLTPEQVAAYAAMNARQMREAQP